MDEWMCFTCFLSTGITIMGWFGRVCRGLDLSKKKYRLRPAVSFGLFALGLHFVGMLKVPSKVID